MSHTKEEREIIARYSQPGGSGIDAAYAQRDGIILAIAELTDAVRQLQTILLAQPTGHHLTADDLWAMTHRSGK